MADNRKEQERDELHRTIWGIANDLRGSVDGLSSMCSACCSNNGIFRQLRSQ